MSVRWILVLMCLFGCAGQESPPVDLLQRAKFTEVLLEAQLIEARVNQESMIDKKADVPDMSYYAEMFKAQGVTEEEFRITYEWYVKHPEELKDIYNDVLSGLQERVDLVDSTDAPH